MLRETLHECRADEWTTYMELLGSGPAAAGERAGGQRGEESGGMLLWLFIACECVWKCKPRTGHSLDDCGVCVT